MKYWDDERQHKEETVICVRILFVGTRIDRNTEIQISWTVKPIMFKETEIVYLCTRNCRKTKKINYSSGETQHSEETQIIFFGI